MFKRNFIFLFIALGILVSLSFCIAKIEIDTDNDGLSDYEEQNVYATAHNNQDTDEDSYPDATEVFYGYSPSENNGAKLTKITLDVPYINESPDGSWTGPWKNACEEASIAMIDNFYLGQKDVSVKKAMDFMSMLFAEENDIWGSNADADTFRTAKLVNDYTHYNATIKDNPTIEDIKTELQQKRPVIIPVYGKTLNNPNTPFLATGSYYHMFIIIGYDDETQEFIAHDTGDTKTGSDHRYKYETIMNSLHDFNFTNHQADGPARAIFTYPKLAKLIASPKVYYLKDNTKQWIVDENSFNTFGFNWDAINIVQPEWLENFKTGNDIKI